MEILVCIKQVPGTSEVEVDEETGVLKRSGIDSKMNPYDLYALETAMRIKEDSGAKVKVMSMGPPQAKEVVREAYMMGVDEGALLSDRKFAGADVLATSYTLSQGVRKMGIPDLIICGKQTTDGDTAQVGPELAEFLGIPHVANVIKLVERKTLSGYEMMRIIRKGQVQAVEKQVTEGKPNLPKVFSDRRLAHYSSKPFGALSYFLLQNRFERVRVSQPWHIDFVLVFPIR